MFFHPVLVSLCLTFLVLFAICLLFGAFAFRPIGPIARRRRRLRRWLRRGVYGL